MGRQSAEITKLAAWEIKNKKRQRPAVGINAADHLRDFGTSRWQLFGQATSEACLAEAR
jgi:hypothetical protein